MCYISVLFVVLVIIAKKKKKKAHLKRLQISTISQLTGLYAQEPPSTLPNKRTCTAHRSPDGAAVTPRPLAEALARLCSQTSLVPPQPSWLWRLCLNQTGPSGTVCPWPAGERVCAEAKGQGGSGDTGSSSQGRRQAGGAWGGLCVFMVARHGVSQHRHVTSTFPAGNKTNVKSLEIKLVKPQCGACLSPGAG